MKHHISRLLKTVAIAYMAFPIIYVPICAILFDIPVAGCLKVLLSPWYYFLSMLAVSVGYGFWEMKRWTWYVFLPVNFLIGYQNAVMANEYGESHHRLSAFLFSISVLLITTYRVAREIRVPYFFPKIRWWESDPRYRLSVPVVVRRGDGNELEANIMDLSMGGCFVKLRTDLAQDELVKLTFDVFGTRIDCEGVTVWRTQSTVTHPKGVGIKFNQLDRAQKRNLRSVNHRLRRIAQLYRKSRYLLNQEEFLKQLQELEARPSRKRQQTG